MTLSNGQKIRGEQKLRKNKNIDIDLKSCLNTLERLVQEDKIKFSFYNNSLLNLDLLQIYYNKHEDKIEIEFRDVIGEYLRELKNILK